VRGVLLLGVFALCVRGLPFPGGERKKLPRPPQAFTRSGNPSVQPG
jgi:hypothetical protein